MDNLIVYGVLVETGAELQIPNTLDGATNLSLNASGNTVLCINIGQTTAIQSLTTDAGGTLRTQGQTFLIATSLNALLCV